MYVYTVYIYVYIYIVGARHSRARAGAGHVFHHGLLCPEGADGLAAKHPRPDPPRQAIYLYISICLLGHTAEEDDPPRQHRLLPHCVLEYL